MSSLFLTVTLSCEDNMYVSNTFGPKMMLFVVFFYSTVPLGFHIHYGDPEHKSLLTFLPNHDVILHVLHYLTCLMPKIGLSGSTKTGFFV